MLSIVFLMPPHFYERVDKWTHEPRSTFKYKKHNPFTVLLLFLLFSNYKQKSKNTFTFCKHKTKTQKELYFSVFTFLLFYLLFYFKFYNTNMKPYA